MQDPKLSHARLEWQDGLPVSADFGDVYFSRASGLDETRHVFLKHNRLAERFAALPAHSHFTIAETGFGTGLNFLCAWQLFLAAAPANSRLHFVSAEKFPLTPADLARALALWPELAEEAGELLKQYAVLPPGWHRFVFADGRVLLTLMAGDVLDVLPELDARVDAWFLDGFAPSKNPDMWQQSLFDHMARLSAPAASFATFTSAGFVRRGLKQAGFAVRKVPGFGHKREMSCGELVTPAGQAWQAPWYARPPSANLTERSALVIGAGIAGAASADSLARRGWRVTVLDKEPGPAQAASGNPQGVLYTKLSAHMTPLTQLVLAGYAYSLRLLRARLPKQEDHWDDCGVLQLAWNEGEAKRQAKLAAAGLPAEMLRPVSAGEASDLAGLPLTSGGLFFPQGGWLHPPALVRCLLDHPAIRQLYNREAVSLRYDERHQRWQALTSDGSLLAEASTLILAGAADIARMPQAAHLPLKRIRGQVSTLPATTDSAALRTVLCGEGYVSPARHGSHCFGATFKFDSEHLDPTLAEHEENLAMLEALVPAFRQTLGEALAEKAGGRAAYRCTSPDYLPLIGPLAERDGFVAAYAELARDASLRPEAASPWLPHCYVNVAHGSRGMITAPLAGEIIAALLENEPAPLPRSLMHAAHPSRFLLRDLMRRKLG
ncbi:bifunctional tRNA (5-methylaminomethyl-2-thiouridine)(34)-methyltransferase MnmD/FAD-dependent 5-carboxymethylaminomethyl-2-thiouridine(34) oxidoreductase MnmC [uncultured Aquitalea sp.]|uniref:bifunctional tRNA (5-methylaminomethyl-2-thiouridine)(34)-methyltransferase MnmD/FAD-dependent 5-carboxymethylaminomethyl-2-thiouridine(34) oxidoreductase MnmC n=1 Tax=uncultured Aquitalea sp. TaxID=540272 RepID=UPI0025CE0B8F|nr:bifunctional tRNA (5-methylaminomethyl-2-thiouridine)(34)-methyltransferase MnmD/FAD-dependent 5-carboxymethylaminomethyl-2-thiouridine(34) oxidoreductase MnmC [uncultured Aquitalea sp.]